MNFNSNSITVRTDAERDYTTKYSQSQSRYNAERTELKAKALEILMNGGYNRYGRDIEEAQYEKMQVEFDRVVANMMHTLETITNNK